jgi:hypothetical protein
MNMETPTTAGAKHELLSNKLPPDFNVQHAGLIGLRFVKFLSLSNDFQKYIGGHPAPSGHSGILIETCLSGKAG